MSLGPVILGMKEYYVYIVANPGRTVLYTGMTNDIQSRVIQHYYSRGASDSFAGKYYCYQLLYYSSFPTAFEAIEAEKYIKGKSRAKKMEIIKKMNPSLAFLNRKVLGYWPPK